MNDVIQKIYDIGIVPVIAIDDADKAVPLAQALVKGGLPAAEVTFRTAAGRGGHPPHRGRGTRNAGGRRHRAHHASRLTGPSPPAPSSSSAPASTPQSPAMSSTRAC